MDNIEKKSVRKPSYGLIKLVDKISFSQVFTLWIIIIVLFSLFYFSLAGITNNSLSVEGLTIQHNTEGFINSLYFSFITATSLGYGDVIPLGISKFLSGFEVILGLIVYGVLISKIVGVKQEVLLEEVYDISYEEVIDRLRSGLYLFRSDINRTLEKIETDTIKQREVEDLWILFSGLDTTLTNIKDLVIPKKSEKYYHKRIDVFRLELFLNSIRLSMNKIAYLLRTLKSRKFKWRNDLLTSSIEEDIKVIRDIINYQFKKSNEKRVVDKLNELTKTLDSIEDELKEDKKNSKKKQKSKKKETRKETKKQK